MQIVTLKTIKVQNLHGNTSDELIANFAVQNGVLLLVQWTV